MRPFKDLLAAAHRDLSDWTQWQARACLLLFAALAGGAVVGFTWLSDLALQSFGQLRAHWVWVPLLWTPAWLVLILWLTRNLAPGAAGSGIPQVMAALSLSRGDTRIGQLVSLWLSAAKALLTAAGLLAGLAIGREGPSVQIAAGVMHHARRWMPRGAPMDPHGLLVAGGAAGIAAAFNAPLAGVMFAIEELSKTLEQRNSGLIITAIVLSGLVAVSIEGNASYFGTLHGGAMSLGLAGAGVLVVLVCGLVGGLFARLLCESQLGGADRVSRWRAAHPYVFAALCGLVLAGLGLLSSGATFGSGYQYTRQLLEGQNHLPLLYVTLRLVATWLAVWSGVPGGIFAPSLAIGAGLGHDMALLAGIDAGAAPLIALGMAAFLAAVTQAPLTAFIIVMEMVDGHALVMTLMAGALGASLVSRWVHRPIYAVLAEAQLRRLA